MILVVSSRVSAASQGVSVAIAGGSEGSEGLQGEGPHPAGFPSRHKAVFGSRIFLDFDR